MSTSSARRADNPVRAMLWQPSCGKAAPCQVCTTVGAKHASGTAVGDPAAVRIVVRPLEWKKPSWSEDNGVKLARFHRAVAVSPSIVMLLCDYSQLWCDWASVRQE
jgi:hypothetical protein